MKKYYIILFVLTSIIGFLYFNHTQVETTKTLERYSERELVLIYLGQTSCPYCKKKNIKDSIKSVDNKLNDLTKKFGISYKKIGIATGWDIEKEYTFLGKILSFNEIIIGNGWSNLGSLWYIYNDFSDTSGLLRSSPATPQIILSIRSYNSIGDTFRGVYDEKLVISLIGNQITNFHEIRFDEIIHENIN
ncbi:MAG: hypothetical protein GVY20_14080 [Bacteroidetes bacterium]|jgi:hypothetical protein|nr:hypothetical protein [Bacteroidota bacterium]